jgi:hypothetical protein
MFCFPGLIFGGTEGVGSFHVLCSRTRFSWYRGHQITFSCFDLSDSFSTVQRVPGPVSMFYAPALVFDDTEGIGSRFHFLHSKAHFRRYRGRRFSFSGFARPNSFSQKLMASGPVFIFCAIELVFRGIEGVRSRFHAFSSRTHLRHYRGRRFPPSCFALPDSFSAVLRASGPILLFCAP